MGTSLSLILFLLFPIVVGYWIHRFIQRASLDQEDAENWYRHKSGQRQYFPSSLTTSTRISLPSYAASRKKPLDQPAGQYSRVDNLVDELSDDERAYLERKLGTPNLVLSDDGELLTPEEYRQQKTDAEG